MLSQKCGAVNSLDMPQICDHTHLWRGGTACMLWWSSWQNLNSQCCLPHFGLLEEAALETSGHSMNSASHCLREGEGRTPLLFLDAPEFPHPNVCYNPCWVQLDYSEGSSNNADFRNPVSCAARTWTSAWVEHDSHSLICKEAACSCCLRARVYTHPLISQSWIQYFIIA